MKQGVNNVRLFIGSNAVDKVYLGTTQVYGGNAPWYITDGLVFHLDGIDKGNNSAYWTDLKGGIAFPLNEHSTIESNAIVMDGQGVIYISSDVPYDFSTSTIEVVSERLGSESYGCVFYNKATGRISFIYSGTKKVATGTGVQNNLFTLDTNSGVNIFSCTPTKVIKNGISFSVISSESWGFKGVTSIGGRSNTGASVEYGCNCRIHSIRIYNRILTDEEITNNQAIDNERFNLGLQLSE